MHVCSVGQRLRLPPEMNGFLFLLLQDQTAQVGLDLDLSTETQTQERQTVSEICLMNSKSKHHEPSPAPAPAASWPLLSGPRTHPPPAASSSSTRSLREFSLSVRSTNTDSVHMALYMCLCVTHGSQGGGAGPVLCLDLGRLVGIWRLSCRKLCRLNDPAALQMFGNICRVNTGSDLREVAAENTQTLKHTKKKKKRNSPCL